MIRPLALAVSLSASAPCGLANDLFTGFEFVDLSGDFTVGAAPLTARFLDGVASNSDIHHSGQGSWMVFPMATAEVTFRVPAQTVDLFFKDETVGVASVLTVFAADGSVLGQFHGTEVSWTQVTIGSAAQPVARMTLQNNFFGSAPFRTVIDDLTYCATPQVGTSYCGPAVPNSTGAPGEMSARGSLAAADNSLTLVAERLPRGQFGYFLNSLTQGFAQPPGSQGNLCLGGAIGRHNEHVTSTGTAGVLVLVLDLTDVPTPTGHTTVLAGETWNFQGWFRDQNPTPTSNFTDAIAVSFL